MQVHKYTYVSFWSRQHTGKYKHKQEHRHTRTHKPLFIPLTCIFTWACRSCSRRVLISSSSGMTTDFKIWASSWAWNKQWKNQSIKYINFNWGWKLFVHFNASYSLRYEDDGLALIYCCCLYLERLLPFVSGIQQTWKFPCSSTFDDCLPSTHPPCMSLTQHL